MAARLLQSRSGGAEETRGGAEPCLRRAKPDFASVSEGTRDAGLLGAAVGAALPNDDAAAAAAARGAAGSAAALGT